MSYTGKESVYESTLFMKEERTACVCVCVHSNEKCMCMLCVWWYIVSEKGGGGGCVFVRYIIEDSVCFCVCVKHA